MPTIRRRRPKTARCKRCKTRIDVKSKGRIPVYCGDTCRQLAYQQRRYTGPMLLLAQDIATTKVRNVIRAEISSLLSQTGIVAGPFPPTEKIRKHRTHLRLVFNSERQEKMSKNIPPDDLGSHD